MRKGDFQYASGGVSLLADLTRTTGLPRDPCRVLQRTPLRMRELTETFHLWKSPKAYTLTCTVSYLPTYILFINQCVIGRRSGLKSGCIYFVSLSK